MRWLVLLMLLGGCPKQPGGPDCWDSARAEDFALPAAATDPDGAMNVTQKLARRSAAECGDSDNAGLAPALWVSKCNRFLEYVMADHCTPRIDAWCDSTCTSAETRDACRNSSRDRLVALCASAALPGMRAAAPFCAALKPDPVTPTVFAGVDGGMPACLP